MSDYRIELNSGRDIELSRREVDTLDCDNNVYQVFAVVYVTDAGECVKEIDFPTAWERDNYMNERDRVHSDWYDLYGSESFELVCDATGETFPCLCNVDVKTVPMTDDEVDSWRPLA